MKYKSTKTYGHNIGLSCAFRQWRAESHCHFVHGYALAVRLEFDCTELDHRNWCQDFGALKPFKTWLESMFDHKLCVATDDPYIEYFRQGHKLGVLDLVEVPAVGCEKFAEMVYNAAVEWLKATGQSPRVTISKVEISEHGANSAIVEV